MGAISHTRKNFFTSVRRKILLVPSLATPMSGMAATLQLEKHNRQTDRHALRKTEGKVCAVCLICYLNFLKLIGYSISFTANKLKKNGNPNIPIMPRDPTGPFLLYPERDPQNPVVPKHTSRGNPRNRNHCNHCNSFHLHLRHHPARTGVEQGGGRQHRQQTGRVLQDRT